MIKPTFEDFPIDGSEDDEKRYIKKKCTEMWRHNKLAGSEASVYWQSELERVKGYQKKKKETEGSASEESGSEHRRKLNHERYVYVKYVNYEALQLVANDTPEKINCVIYNGNYFI